MGKYFENRQNATKATEEEMDAIFGCVVEYFSHKWLKSPRSHPLQKLWNRKDALSTNELYFFGSCIKELSRQDAKWLKQQVTLIKSDQSNNRQGAIWEILALGILFSPHQRITPAKLNNAGYDGTLSFEDLKAVNISLKNYGDSAHLKEFNRYAKQVEENLKIVLKAKQIRSIQILIDSPKGFPTINNWQDLLNQLPVVLSDIEQGKPKSFSIADFWFFSYGDLADDYQEFHPNYNSYQIIISSPYHKNEEKNLLDKLEESCLNLSKHAVIEDDNIINAVFIHLPETASIIQCKEWAEEYIASHQQKPITLIILYQPSVAKNWKQSTSFIHHCFQFIFSEKKMARWNQINRKINLRIPVGIQNLIPSENQIIVERDGKSEVIRLGNRYLYQRGNLYLEAKRDSSGTISGNIKNLASGIITHSIFQPFPNQQSVVLSGHFPPEDKLLIL
jgi:hypothetical protein